MNLQQLKRSFERFKRWQRRTPTFRLASKEEHRCLCCGHTYRGNYCPRCSQKAEHGHTIRYESGEKVEFDKQGNWKEIDCRSTLVPVELIPEEIKANINATFPNAIILKIERSLRGYEVKLNNGLEVEYSPSFQVIDIDD